MGTLMSPPKPRRQILETRIGIQMWGHQSCIVLIDFFLVLTMAFQVEALVKLYFRKKKLRPFELNNIIQRH